MLHHQRDKTPNALCLICAIVLSSPSPPKPLVREQCLLCNNSQQWGGSPTRDSTWRHFYRCRNIRLQKLR